MEREAAGDDEVGRVVARLEAVAEDLAELAMSRLREALAATDLASDPGAVTPATRAVIDAAKAEERRLTRARRAVERAAAILGGPGDDGVGTA